MGMKSITHTPRAEQTGRLSRSLAKIRRFQDLATVNVEVCDKPQRPHFDPQCSLKACLSNDSGTWCRVTWKLQSAKNAQAARERFIGIVWTLHNVHDPYARLAR